jgi:hypothetical protein
MEAFKVTLVASIGACAIVFASALVSVPAGLAQNNPAESGGAIAPSFEEPWGDAMSSSEGPALAPAPEESVEPESGSMFMPQPSVGLIERPGFTPISPTSPTLIQPESFGAAAGGFQPDGGFHGPIR